MDTNEIINSLKRTLTEKRFEHTMNVADLAKELAILNGVSSDKAYIAALLHDCAKCMPKGELTDNIQKYAISLDYVSKASPQLWHSYVGACVAKDIYGIEDKDILDAIYYHTIGSEDMSTLCAIIYLADAIEQGRSYTGVEEIRALARKSLWDAVLLYTDMSIKFIIQKGNLIHPNAISLRNKLILGRNI